MPMRNTFAVRAVTAALLPFRSVAMTGCNTVEGTDKHIAAGGEGVPDLSIDARR